MNTTQKLTAAAESRGMTATYIPFSGLEIRKADGTTVACASMGPANGRGSRPFVSGWFRNAHGYIVSVSTVNNLVAGIEAMPYDLPADATTSIEGHEVPVFRFRGVPVRLIENGLAGGWRRVTFYGGGQVSSVTHRELIALVEPGLPDDTFDRLVKIGTNR